jgi:predicted DNA-binding antitoxin AbrB/MazE fold protein
MTIRAKYEDGVFKPLDDVDLKEGTVLEIYLPTRKPKRFSVKNSPITGMWKDRRDIKDGLSYVDRLRENPRA